jgi:heme A synthase
MRDLNLLETGCLAGLLLLSLLLPILLARRIPQHPAIRRDCLRTVWLGQGVLMMAGMAVVFIPSPAAAALAAAFGTASCVLCAVVLHRQLRAVPREVVSR